MQRTNRFAFKEWSVVCEALNAGSQSLILRKGGIHEGQEGFRVEHPEFWLFPTEFHQSAEVLIPEAAPLIELVRIRIPVPGMIPIQNYIEVVEVIEIRDETFLERLAGMHIWSEATVHERFHYRSPGLFLLLVRTYRRPEPIYLPELSHFAGCRSWVDFPIEIETVALKPILSNEEHIRRMDAIRDAIA